MSGPEVIDRLERERRVKKAIEESNILRQQKRFHQGIDVLHEALKFKLNEDQIYYSLGNIYCDFGDLEQAETAYQRAIEINKDHVNAHHNLSVVYKRKGRISKFVKMIKKKAKLSVETAFK